MNLMLIDMALAPELLWLEQQLFEESQVPLRILSTLHPAIRVPLIGFTAAEIVATELADFTLQEGVVGALDLYTPEIRRFEETALVGLGGMRI
jgi:hypothetical protein